MQVISSDNLNAFEDFLFDYQSFCYELRLLVQCEANEYSRSEWQRLLFSLMSLFDQNVSDFSVLFSCIRKGLDINADRD